MSRKSAWGSPSLWARATIHPPAVWVTRWHAKLQWKRGERGPAGSGSQATPQDPPHPSSHGSQTSGCPAKFGAGSRETAPTSGAERTCEPGGDAENSFIKNL